jgi:adenylate cyclase
VLPAGIVGQERYQFDIRGDTVNVAARLVGKGKPGCVALTEEDWRRIHDRFGANRWAS